MFAGNRQHALADPNSVVLAQPIAGRLFGSEIPVGKTVSVYIRGKWVPLKVTAVASKLPDNLSVNFDVLARVDLDPDFAAGKNNWDMAWMNVYVKLLPGVKQADVEQRLRYFSKKYLYTSGDELAQKMGLKKNAQGDYGGLRLLPVTDLHFNTEVGSDASMNKSFLYMLLLIAAVILLVACFNFVNLSIGVAFTRFKEIGIRKCLGARRRQVWTQVWSENIFLIVLSLLLGIGLSLLLIKQFNRLFGAGISASLLGDPLVLTGLVLLVLLISLVASGYPSTLLSRLKVTEILKGKLRVKTNGGLKDVLIVLQFIVAVVLMSATVVIYLQFQYLRKAPLGYESENLVSVPVALDKDVTDVADKMRRLLQNQSTVESVSASNINMGVGKDGSTNKEMFGFEYDDKHVRTAYMAADYNIIKTLGMKLSAGRDFTMDYAADTQHNVIVTESFVKKLDLKNPVGLRILHDSASPPWTIVGVIPDFHLYSLFNQIEPLTIGLEPKHAFSYLLIKVRAANLEATMNLLRDAYHKVIPGAAFMGSYVNENIDRWYRTELQLSKMFSVAAMLAIILSCMGLFGMAFIVVGQRTKEIGVRKVLGASVSNITTLVSKEFIKPVVIAIIIATPIALWALNKWLQHFTYRVTLTWWVFAAAGVAALAIAVLTVGFQAIRAAIANPVDALRNE